MVRKLVFPDGFVWGSIAACNQIGGAAINGNQTSLARDASCHSPSKAIAGDADAVVNSCDPCWRDDIEQMKRLGHKAYCFSPDWMQILPGGTGEASEEGLKFYSDLIDALLSNGIEPYLTIFRGEMPQALENRGGWDNDESIGWLKEYASVLYRVFGGRVKKWITIHDPFAVSFSKHCTDSHVPGSHDLERAVRVSYNCLRAHSAVVRLFREMNIPGEIGIGLCAIPSLPASNAARDQMAARYMDGCHNRWFLDPLFKGRFPGDMVTLFKVRGLKNIPDFSEACEISEAIDFLGLSYYASHIYTYDKECFPFYAAKTENSISVTNRGWPIRPKDLRDMIIRIHTEYDHVPPVYVIGSGRPDLERETDGEAADDERSGYIRAHLTAIHYAIEYGIDVRGYFVRNFLDGLGKAGDYSNIFGLASVDRHSWERTPKKNACWHRQIIERNALEVEE